MNRSPFAYCVTVMFLVATLSAAAARAEPISTGSDYAHPELDGFTASLVYHRLIGTSPELRLYAEHSAAYQRATTFERERVLSAETASLDRKYRNLNLSDTYSLRLGVSLQQYDMDQKGFSLGIGEASYIPVLDNVIYKNYGIRFVNRENVNFFAMPENTAKDFYRKYNLFSLPNAPAAQAILQMSFKVLALEPATQRDAIMMQAQIVAARLVSSTGQTMHDFGVLPDAARPSQDTMKAFDIQGLDLGMTVEQLTQQARAKSAQQLGSAETGAILFFNGLQLSRKAAAPNPLQGSWPGVSVNGAARVASQASDYAVCAGVQTGRQDSDERIQGQGPPKYDDCLAIVVSRPTDGSAAHPQRIISDQALANTDPATLRKQLDDKYGTPTSVANEGNYRTWIGHDAAQPGAEDLQVEAKINAIGQHADRLVVLVHRYANPNPRQASPAPSPPKL